MGGYFFIYILSLMGCIFTIDWPRAGKGNYLSKNKLIALSITPVVNTVMAFVGVIALF